MLDIDEHRALVWCERDAIDLLADRAGEEASDLAGHGIGAQHGVVAEGSERAAKHLTLTDIGLDPHPSVGVEPQPVRAGQERVGTQ